MLFDKENQQPGKRKTHEGAATGVKKSRPTLPAVSTGDRRRSSFSLRGKRKSSYGPIQQAVHADVPMSDLCQHISVDLPDPVRLRQLLVYSLQRQIDALSSVLQPDETCVSEHQQQQQQQRVNMGVAQVLQEALLTPLLHKHLNTSWYHRPRDPVVIVSKPNPQNKELEMRARGYKCEVRRVRNMAAEWRQWRLSQQEQSINQEMKPDPQNNLADVSLDKALQMEHVGRLLSAEIKADLGHQVDIFHAELNQLTNLNEVERQVDEMMSKLHGLKVTVEQRQDYINDHFGHLIDATWPEDDDDDITTATTDIGTAPTEKRRLSKAQVRRASLMGLPMPASPNRKNPVMSTDVGGAGDSTMSFLRVLSTALSTEPNSNSTGSSV